MADNVMSDGGNVFNFGGVLDSVTAGVQTIVTAGSEAIAGNIGSKPVNYTPNATVNQSNAPASVPSSQIGKYALYGALLVLAVIVLKKVL